MSIGAAFQDGVPHFPEKDPFEGEDMVMESPLFDYAGLPCDNDELKQFVDDAFELIDRDFKRIQPLERQQIEHEMQKHKKIIREPRHCFNEKFVVQNHMVKCFIRCIDTVEKDGIRYPIKTKLPLVEMSRKIDHAILAQWSFPSLLIFSYRTPCSANVSPSGVINITGGYSSHQLKEAIVYFVDNTLRAIKEITGNTYVLEDIHFKSRTATTKIGACKIDTISLRDFCSKNGITTLCNPHTINCTQIYPFPETMPSVIVRIFPAGGLVLMGFKTNFQTNVVVNFLKKWLWKFLREDLDFKGWPKYLASRARERDSRLRKSLEKKAKKIKERENDIREKDNRGVYEAWALTEDCYLARSFLRKTIINENVEKKELRKKYRKRAREFDEAYEKQRCKKKFTDIVKAFFHLNKDKDEYMAQLEKLQKKDAAEVRAEIKQEKIDMKRYNDQKYRGTGVLTEEPPETIRERINQ